MTLGVILAIGESFTDLEEKGQASRLIDYNIKLYSQEFDEVFIFSYADEKWDLPPNCKLVANKFHLNRFIYSFLMPFLNIKYFIKCDVIRSLQITGGISAVIAKLFLRKSFVVNYGYNYQDVAKLEDKSVQSLLYPYVTSFVVRFASAVIITSNQFTKYVKSRYKKAKVVLLPNGVDIDLFKLKNEKPGKFINTLFVGRLEKEKNLEVFLRALAKFDKVKFTLLGKGTQMRALKELSKKLNVDIDFKGIIPYRDISKYYNESELFVLPSVSEGNPKVLLEAQSSGLVCIASNIPAHREIITSDVNGILCSPTVNGFSQALKKVLTNYRFRRTISLAARKNAVENYNINVLLAKEIKLLKSIAREPK